MPSIFSHCHHTTAHLCDHRALASRRVCLQCAWGDGTCINMFVCIFQKPFKRLERTHWHFEGVHGCGNTDRPDNLDGSSSWGPRTKKLWSTLKLAAKRPQGNHNEIGDGMRKKMFLNYSSFKCVFFFELFSICARLSLPLQFNWKSKPFEGSLIQKNSFSYLQICQVLFCCCVSA